MLQIGKKYGKLTITNNGIYRGVYLYVNTKCDCGNFKIIRESSVRDGITSSCGCLKKNNASIHNMSKTRFYDIYRCMKYRCGKKKRYLKIKCLWNSFVEFKNDMYDSYVEHCNKFSELQTTLDRIDNSGNYCKDNCRWATYVEQSNNRYNNKKITFNNETMNLNEWSKKFSIPSDTLSYRLKNWKNIDKCFNTPIRRYLKI